MTGEVHQLQSAPPQQATHGGGGNGHDLHGRVSAIEARMNYLATKSDVESIRSWALKGALAGMVVAATLTIAVLKLFE